MMARSVLTHTRGTHTHTPCTEILISPLDSGGLCAFLGGSHCLHIFPISIDANFSGAITAFLVSVESSISRRSVFGSVFGTKNKKKRNWPEQTHSIQNK